MAELIRHELYKIFTRRAGLAAMLFFLLLLGFMSYLQVKNTQAQYGNLRDYYQTVYKGHEGPVSEDQAAAANEDIKSVLSQVTGRMTIAQNRAFEYDQYAHYAYENAQTRSNRITEYLDNANYAKFEHGQNSFEYRNAARRYRMINALPPAGNYFIFPWQDVVDFPNIAGCLMIFALLLLGISPVISEEYSTGVDALILTSKNGKCKTALAKIISVILYSTAVAAGLTCIHTGILLAVYGTDGASSPIQSIFTYISSPYSLRIGEYFLIELAVCIFAAVCFGLLILTLSSVFKNVLLPFFIGGCLFALTLACSTLLYRAIPDYLRKISDFSFSQLLRAAPLFEDYQTYNIFGHPVSYLALMIVLFAAVSSAAAVFSAQAFSRHQVK